MMQGGFSANIAVKRNTPDIAPFAYNLLFIVYLTAYKIKIAILELNQ